MPTAARRNLLFKRDFGSGEAGPKIRPFLLVLVLALAACAPEPGAVRSLTPSPSPDPGPIRIGSVFCLTGVMEFADGPALRGARLAAAEVNQNGGVLGRPLVLENQDCKNDPLAAASAASQLIQGGAQAILTSGTYYFGAPASREAQKAGLVGLSPAASSSLFGSKTLGDLQFTLSMWNNTMGAAAAEYAFTSRGWRTVSVISDQSIDYTQSLGRYFSDQFARLGGTVLSQGQYPEGQADFSPQLAQIQALPRPPDFIYIPGGMPDLANVIHTLRQAGVEAPILGGDSYDDPALAKALAPGEVREIYYVTHTFLAPGVTPGMAHFIEAYTAAYGQAPDSGLAASGWDALMVLAQAIQKAGSTSGPAVARAMETTGFDLLTGRLRWTDAALGHQPDIQAAIVRLDPAPQFVTWLRPGQTPPP